MVVVLMKLEMIKIMENGTNTLAEQENIVVGDDMTFGQKS